MIDCFAAIWIGLAVESSCAGSSRTATNNLTHGRGVHCITDKCHLAIVIRPLDQRPVLHINLCNIGTFRDICDDFLRLSSNGIASVFSFANLSLLDFGTSSS